MKRYFEGGWCFFRGGYVSVMGGEPIDDCERFWGETAIERVRLRSKKEEEEGFYGVPVYLVGENHSQRVFGG